MKKLILVFVMWPMMVSVFGQNQRKSITDTVFQLDQAIVKETIKKKPFESGCSFKNITNDGDYFVVGCFGTEEYSES